MTTKQTHIVAALLVIFVSLTGRESSLPVAPYQPANTNAPGGLNPDNPPCTDTTAAGEKDAPGTFEVGEIAKIDDQDYLVVYYNCLGRITEKGCAEFYRKGKMDSTQLSLAGTVRDYYINDTLAFEAQLENSLLNGLASYFHRNGKLRAKGRYKDNRKTGVWTFFYDNGNPEKIINFVRGFPFIVAYHKRNGKQVVEQGNGIFKDVFSLGNSCSPYKISGRVIEGKMHGKWKIYDDFNHEKVATEYYDHGKFIKRESNGEIFTGQPMISIHGFYPNESLLWTESTAGCAESYLQVLKFRGQDIHTLFYTEILDSLNTLVRDTLPDQWLIAGIQINQNSLVHGVKVKSSIDDQATESRIYEMLKSMMYFSINTRIGDATDVSFLFTILLRENKVIIPADLYYKQLMESMPNFSDSDDDS